jgi:hypothetical protein
MRIIGFQLLGVGVTDLVMQEIQHGAHFTKGEMRYLYIVVFNGPLKPRESADDGGIHLLPICPGESGKWGIEAHFTRDVRVLPGKRSGIDLGRQFRGQVDHIGLRAIVGVVVWIHFFVSPYR